MAIPLVLDCDTGTDDAVAIMLAALHLDLTLEAVTTVAGNVPVTNCTDNSLRVLDHIGRGDIPVYEGSSAPLARRVIATPRDDDGHHAVHGRTLDIPPAHSSRASGHAVEFLVRHFDEASRAGRDVTLVAVGPLTNLALAIKCDPMFPQHVTRLVIMGGGHEVGNVTPSAEFNIWADPEAADVVLTSGIVDVLMVPLDATHRALVSLEDCQRLKDLGSPAAVATAAFVEKRIRAYDDTQPMERSNAAPVHDALCVASLVDPTILHAQKYRVDVETHGELTVGRTVVDTHCRSGLEPNARVAFDADERKFVDMLVGTFTSRIRPNSERLRSAYGEGE